MHDWKSKNSIIITAFFPNTTSSSGFDKEITTRPFHFFKFTQWIFEENSHEKVFTKLTRSKSKRNIHTPNKWLVISLIHAKCIADQDFKLRYLFDIVRAAIQKSLQILTQCLKGIKVL